MLVVMMVMVFTPSVVAVNPVMAVFTPMAGNPNHLPVAVPVTFAVGVIRAIANLDPNLGGLHDRRQRQTRRDRGNKQKLFLCHINI